MTAPFLGFGVAAGIGLLIGLERERSKGSGTGRRAAGIRTFALASLAGAAASYIAGAALLIAVEVVLGALVGLSYSNRRATDPGLTSEVALLMTPLIGAMALSAPLLASGVGVAVAVLLTAKPAIHKFARRTLTAAELADALVFGIVTLVIWPQLPDRPMGPLGALNPHLIWLVVILILAIGGAGHVMTRAFGTRYGLPLSGLASGFVSSVATVGAMGSKAKADPRVLAAAVAGGVLSSVATFVEMALVLGAVSLPTLLALAMPLGAGGLTIAGFGGWYTLRAARARVQSPLAGRAFNLWSALLLAASMAGILVLTAFTQPLFGGAGLVVSAALGGIVDTHAAAMSVASIVRGGKIPPDAAAVPILAAMTVNAAMKIAMAASAGSVAYVWRIGVGVGVSIAASWAAASAVGLF